jgi:hypothetical protein
MSDKKQRLEDIIESTLEEAKKKVTMKTSEASRKKKEKEEEYEDEDEDDMKHKKMKKKEHAVMEQEHNEEYEEELEEEEEKEKDPMLAPKKKLTPAEHAKRNKAKGEGYKASLKRESYEDEEDLDEASSMGAESLKPNSRPKDEPKSVVMSQMMQMAGGMSKEDLNKFAATMAQFGPNKDYGAPGKSEHNQASIDMKTGKGPKTKDPMPKLVAKEDVEAMFVGEDLTEEFKEKASTLFEAAVNARVSVEVERLQEQYEEALTEELETFTEEITEKLDAYLDYVVENWMEENEVAVESTLRNEIMEEFMDGLRNLFAEHYVDVPESKIDIVEALAEKVDTLETTLDEVIVENNEMKEIISDVAMNEIFDELSSDLVVTHQEKFRALAEGIEFDGDVETYEKKLRIIKETYFSNDGVASSNLEEETFEGDISDTRNVNPVVNRYVQALTRTVKK